MTVGDAKAFRSTSLNTEERQEIIKKSALFDWLFGLSAIPIWPLSMQPLQPDESIPRSGRILLDTPVQERAIAFCPRQAASAGGTRLVANLRTCSARFTGVIAGSKLLLAPVQGIAVYSQCRRPYEENDCDPLTGATLAASHVSVLFDVFTKPPHAQTQNKGRERLKKESGFFVFYEFKGQSLSTSARRTVVLFLRLALSKRASAVRHASEHVIFVERCRSMGWRQ
jgi:hypothetical protein